MNDQIDPTTLQRKAGAGRTPFEAAGMTPAKAFRLALSRAAQDELDMAARVVSVGQERANLAHLLDSLEQDTLLMLLEGPQGAKGLAVFDAQLLAAVIEVQTMGHVSQATAVARPPTRTDSAMCETVLDRILQEFEGHLAGEKAEIWATGFRFGERADGVRLLGLALADIEYRLFTLSLDLSEGAKTGELLLALPAEGCGVARKEANSTVSWEQALGRSVCASHVEITAVLHRAEVPLDVARGYKTGDLVPVPKPAVSKVLLQGSDGRTVGRARLGQQDGFRALRISQGDVVVTPDSLAGLSGELSFDGTSVTPEIEGGDMLPEDLAMDAMIEAGQTVQALPKIPIAPMQDLPMGDAVDIPMAPMPMDLETS